MSKSAHLKQNAKPHLHSTAAFLPVRSHLIAFVHPGAGHHFICALSSTNERCKKVRYFSKVAGEVSCLYAASCTMELHLGAGQRAYTHAGPSFTFTCCSHCECGKKKRAERVNNCFCGASAATLSDARCVSERLRCERTGTTSE